MSSRIPKFVLGQYPPLGTGTAPPNACSPPQASSTQPCGCDAELFGANRTLRAISQFGQNVPAGAAPAEPNGWSPPQPSSVRPDTLAAVLPGMSTMSRAMAQFAQ